MEKPEHETAYENDIHAQLHLVEEVFRRYRETQLEQAGNIEFSLKNDESPVTRLDVEIENSLRNAFQSRFPGVPVYGEEVEKYNPNTPYFWLIDPIDGTKSFVNGLPYFTNMAALVVEGQTQAAIIYNPTTDRAYTTQAGKGTFINGKKVELNRLPSSNVIYVKEEFHDAMREIVGDNFSCAATPSGGGFGFTAILDGTADARLQLRASGTAHDYAPGALLIREAGGVIIPIRDQVYSYKSNSFVACRSELSDTFWRGLPMLRRLEN